MASGSPINLTQDLRRVIKDAGQYIEFLQQLDTTNLNFKKCQLSLRNVQFKDDTLEFDPKFREMSKEVEVKAGDAGNQVRSKLTTSTVGQTSSIKINTGYVIGTGALDTTTTLSLPRVEKDFQIDMSKPDQNLSLSPSGGEEASRTEQGPFRATLKSKAQLIQGAFTAKAHLTGKMLFGGSEWPVEELAQTIDGNGGLLKPFDFFPGDRRNSNKALTWDVSGYIDVLVETTNVVNVRK